MQLDLRQVTTFSYDQLGVFQSFKNTSCFYSVILCVN